MGKFRLHSLTVVLSAVLLMGFCTPGNGADYNYPIVFTPVQNPPTGKHIWHVTCNLPNGTNIVLGSIDETIFEYDTKLNGVDMYSFPKGTYQLTGHLSEGSWWGYDFSIYLDHPIAGPDTMTYDHKINHLIGPHGESANNYYEFNCTPLCPWPPPYTYDSDKNPAPHGQEILHPPHTDDHKARLLTAYQRYFPELNATITGWTATGHGGHTPEPSTITLSLIAILMIPVLFRRRR